MNPIADSPVIAFVSSSSALALTLTLTLTLATGCEHRAREERITIIDAGRVTVVDNTGVDNSGTGAERSAAQTAPEVTVYGYGDAGRVEGADDQTAPGRTTLTAGEQSVAPADVALAQKVRAALGKDTNLAARAKDVEIVSEGGVVTLRGSVRSAAEKAAFEADAKKVAGVKRIDNQLAIEAK